VLDFSREADSLLYPQSPIRACWSEAEGNVEFLTAESCWWGRFSIVVILSLVSTL